MIFSGAQSRPCHGEVASKGAVFFVLCSRAELLALPAAALSAATVIVSLFGNYTVELLSLHVEK